jgi:hypothetical protein
MKWPKVGDNPFLVRASDSRSRTWASLSWLANLDIDDSFLAAGFKEAADIIVGQLEQSTERKRADILFLPIAYLYRHSFELQMKRIIRLGIALKLKKDGEAVKKALGSHNLATLWHHARAVIIAAWPNGSKSGLSGPSAIVQKFHEADKSGQGLRYTRDLDGKSTLHKLPKSVSLTQLRDVSGGFFNLLGGCVTHLEVGLDNQEQ